MLGIRGGEPDYLILSGVFKHVEHWTEISAVSLTGVVSSDLKNAFQPFTQDSFQGKWQVVFFWPKDFTFVCPTEIAAFGKLDKEFKARDAQILGVSIDSEFVHLAWRRDKDELKNLPFRCWPTSSVS